MVIAWLALGAILTLPLLYIAKRSKPEQRTHLFGLSLVVAALIYVGFAMAWSTAEWVLVEFLGVIVYGMFYWLGVKNSTYWLSAGWLLHPVWDVILHLTGPGSHLVPTWYAVACASFDLVVAAFIAIEARFIQNAHSNQHNRPFLRDNGDDAPHP